ncbi:MAG: chain-length determining protein [Prevotella sp.]|nr:chain-length determining protein [Prevotella sp.]
MTEERKAKSEVIDLRVYARKLWAGKKVYLKTLSLTFLLACVYILGVPRTYTSDTSLAPELGNSMSGTSTLGSIASAFGFDLNNIQTSDAITPLLYPDLMKDNGFVTSLFDVKVQTVDGELQTTYYDYLRRHQKISIWSLPLVWLKNLVKSIGSSKDDSPAGEAVQQEPYHLTRTDNEVAEAVRANISFAIDKKTGVITISTQAQDPLICKTMADSVKDRLQRFITDYRTSKARIDYNYYKQLTDDALEEYRKVRQTYGKMSDANTNVVLRSRGLELEDLENDMQQKYTAYTTFNTQLQAAKARIQERTPAFTVLQGASVPLKAAKPKRMIFVATMVLLAFFATTAWLLRHDIGSALQQSAKA